MTPTPGLLLIALLLAPPGAETAVAPSGWPAAAEQYAALDPARQQQWIVDLLARLDRASQVVLAPDEAAAERARHDALLRHVAQDRTLAQSDVLQLLEQTDQRERSAVEHLARQFRIRVYDTFRMQRDEYARRRAACTQALASWQAAGAPFDRQHRLIDWLEAALRSSTPGSVAFLPAVPNFEPPTELPQPLVLHAPPEAIEQPPPLPPSLTFPREPVESAQPRAVPPTIAGQLPGDVPPLDRAAPPVPPSAVAERLPSADGSLAAARPAGQPPTRTIDRPQALLPRLPEAPPPASSATDPSPQSPPPQPAEPQPPQPAGPPLRINLAELAAQTAGANLTLQTLETELDEDRPWNARQLRPLVERLAVLVIRLDDLAMFHALVSPELQQRVGRLQSPGAAISRLGARIFEARTRAEGPDFAGTQAQRRDELRQLDELSRRLAEMAPRQ